MIILSIFIPTLLFASSFDEGVNRTKTLQERAERLLKRAGVVFETGETAAKDEEQTPAIFSLHALPTSVFLPTGALAFGATKLEMLVGDEASPIQVEFSENNRALFGMKILGKATQARGRIFAEFDQLVTKQGRTIPISAALLDHNGALGIKGENENPKLLEIAGSTLLGVIASPKEDAGAFGLNSEIAKKSASYRVKESLLQESRGYLRDQIKESPLIKLERGTSVTVLFKTEVRF